MLILVVLLIGEGMLVFFLWVDLEVSERVKVVIIYLKKENIQLQEEIKVMNECRFLA